MDFKYLIHVKSWKNWGKVFSTEFKYTVCTLMQANHKNILTLELQSPSTERIIVHSSSQQTLASAVGTRDAARENDLYSSAIVLLISFPKPWMGKYM